MTQPEPPQVEVRRLVALQAAGFRPLVADEAVALSAGLPGFLHAATGLRVRLVPDGEFQMGFSAQEEVSARSLAAVPPISPEEMRPVQVRTIGSHLMACQPLSQRFLAEQLGFDCASPAADLDHPAFLSRQEAAMVLARLGARWPLECEWEQACRAGSQTLFCFGDTLPDEPELARWLDWNLASPSLRANAWGFSGLFFGEWCGDPYRASLARDLVVDPAHGHVIRGGGAYFWPWQAEEWVWCMSAMRMPSSDLLDGLAVVRPVFDLPTPDER